MRGSPAIPTEPTTDTPAAADRRRALSAFRAARTKRAGWRLQRRRLDHLGEPARLRWHPAVRKDSADSARRHERPASGPEPWHSTPPPRMCSKGQPPPS